MCFVRLREKLKRNQPLDVYEGLSAPRVSGAGLGLGFPVRFAFFFFCFRVGLDGFKGLSVGEV